MVGVAPEARGSRPASPANRRQRITQSAESCVGGPGEGSREGSKAAGLVGRPRWGGLGGEASVGREGSVGRPGERAWRGGPGEKGGLGEKGAVGRPSERAAGRPGEKGGPCG